MYGAVFTFIRILVPPPVGSQTILKSKIKVKTRHQEAEVELFCSLARPCDLTPSVRPSKEQKSFASSLIVASYHNSYWFKSYLFAGTHVVASKIGIVCEVCDIELNLSQLLLVTFTHASAFWRRPFFFSFFCADDSEQHISERAVS